MLETIHQLPQEFDLEELTEHLIFMEKVEKGLTQLDKEETKSNEEVKKVIQSW